MRRSALSKYHAFNSDFKNFEDDDFGKTMQSLRVKYTEMAFRRSSDATNASTPTKGGNIELKDIDLSPPVKDVEEGLYFFDASPDKI